MGSWLGCCGTGQGQVVELLWMRQWTLWLHKMRRIPWLAEELLASQTALCNHLKWKVCMTDSWQMLHTFVHLHQFAIHQPQTLQYSTIVTQNKCFPTPNCVAARKYGPVCRVRYPLLSISFYHFALCEAAGRKPALLCPALTAVRHCAHRRVLQWGLLRMRSRVHFLVVLWVMTTYSLVGD